jgi:membrane-associated phospholipid phosphatase
MDQIQVAQTTSLPFSPPYLRRALRWVGFWLVLFILALLLDRPIAQHLRDSGFAHRFAHSPIAEILKIGGLFWSTFAIATLVLVTHSWRWRAAALVLLAGIVSGINGLVKWSIGRYRPFKYPARPGELLPFQISFFPNGLKLSIGANQCFPSGHAALAFATAAMLAILIPKYRYLFYALAATVAAERVLENAHYTSDVVAAAILGIAGSKIVYWISVQLFKSRDDPSAQAPMGN